MAFFSKNVTFKKIIFNFEAFWERNPALFFGLTLFLGALWHLQTAWALLPLPLLLCYKKWFFQTLMLFLVPGCLIYQFYTFPTNGDQIKGRFYIQSAHKTERFGEGWNYQGTLIAGGKKMRCYLFSKNYHPPDKVYRLVGKVSKVNKSSYKMKTEEPWIEEKQRYTLAGYRMEAKERLKSYISYHIKQERAAKFLIGMTTGELEERVMKKELQDLGLSHLMSISGLHFSLIALFFHLFFRLFLPHKIEAASLIVLMTAYLLFVGESPSIVRAWIAIVIFLFGKILERRSSALNSLGASLFLSLLWNPLSAATVSFQLSYLATGGILCFYTPCERFLALWLPQKRLSAALNKSLLWQHGYIFLSFFRSALSLTLAVHLAICPVMIAFFHTFSINSLVYNLFFPFLASAALLLFLVSLFLGHWAHVVNGYYCDWILRVTASPQIRFESFYFETIPTALLAAFTTLLLLAAVSCKVKESADRFGIFDRPLFDHV